MPIYIYIRTKNILKMNKEVGMLLYVYITLRNVAVTSCRNVANQKSYVIIIARKEGGAWERIIINAPQAVDRSEG